MKKIFLAVAICLCSFANAQIRIIDTFDAAGTLDWNEFAQKEQSALIKMGLFELENKTQGVKEIGYQLGLPKKFIEKAPEDGLTGKTDEDNLGFTYAVLDRYLETGEIDDQETLQKIERLHRLNLHKVNPMPTYRRDK